MMLKTISPDGEHDFTKYHMFFVDPGSTFQPTNQISGTVYVKFRLRTRMKYLKISVIHLSLPSEFREKLWVGLGLGVGIG